MSAVPGGDRGWRAGPLLLALSVGLVLSDSSVVTLALPSILREFDARCRRSHGCSSRSTSRWPWRRCPAGSRRAAARARPSRWRASASRRRRSAVRSAPSLSVLVGARAAQGVLGAILVAAALELLTRCTDRHRAIGLWAAAGVLGGAVGPALGGFLTEAFSWEAMFALQAPVTLVALLGLIGVPASPRLAGPGAPRTRASRGRAARADTRGCRRRAGHAADTLRMPAPGRAARTRVGAAGRGAAPTATARARAARRARADLRRARRRRCSCS